MFNINKLITRIRESDKQATPPNSPGGGQLNSSRSPSAGVDVDADVDTNETAEGFLCPTCMEGFPSPEELSDHYESRHAADVGRLHVCPVCKTKFPTVDQLQLHYASDHPPVSRTIGASGNEADLRSLRQEVAELQTTLREERWYSDELKKEVGRLTDGVNRGEEPEENALMKHQLKALEESRSLLSSEVVLLRNQLADAVDTNTSLKQQKETLEQKAASMAGERASLLAAIDEERSMRAQLESRLSEMKDLKTNLEAQLQQRPEADDVRALRQELVQVQTSMDKMSREREQERNDLQQENDKLLKRTRELEELLDEANTKFVEEVQSLRKLLDEKSNELNLLAATQLVEQEQTAKEFSEKVQRLEGVLASKDVDFQRQADGGARVVTERNELTEQLANVKSEFEVSREECSRLEMRLNELEHLLVDRDTEFNAEKSSLEERERVTASELMQRDEQINELKNKIDEITLSFQEKDSQLSSSKKQLSTLKSHFQAQSSEADDVKAQLREIKLELESEQRNRRNEEEKVKDLESEVIRRSESMSKLESERLDLYAKIEAGDGANEAIHQLRQKELTLTEELVKSQQTVAHHSEELAKLNDELHRRLQEYKLQSETDAIKLSKLEAALNAATEQLTTQEERGNQLENSLQTKTKAYQSSEMSWHNEREALERSLQAYKTDLDGKSVELEASNVKLARALDELAAAIQACQTLESNLENQKQKMSQITTSHADLTAQNLELDKKYFELEDREEKTNRFADTLQTNISELLRQVNDRDSTIASNDNRIKDLESINDNLRSKEDQLQQQLNAARRIVTDTIKEINSGLREEQSCFYLQSDGIMKPFEKEVEKLSRALLGARTTIEKRDEDEKQLKFRAGEMEGQISAYKLEMAQLLCILDSKKAELLEKESRFSDMQESTKRKQIKLNELDTIVKEAASSLLASEAKCKRQEEELEGLRVTSESMSSALQQNERELNDIRLGLGRLSNEEGVANGDEQLLKHLLEKAEKVKCHLEDRVTTLKQELDSSNQSLQSNMLQKTSLETELFDAQTTLVDFEERHARQQQQIQDLNQQISQETEDKKKNVAELEEAVRQANELQKRLMVTEEQYRQEVASHKETQRTVEMEVEQLEQRMADVSSQLADALSAKDSLAQELEQLKSLFESQVGALTDNLSALRSELASEQDKCDALEKKVDGLNGDKLEFEAKLENLLDERRALLERCLSSESECEKLRLLTVELRRKLDDALSALHELGRENQTLQLETAKHVNRKWASDSEVDSCTMCQKIFSVTNRKHHCRNCGNIFCHECSAHNATVPAHKKPVRVCDTCFGELGTK